MTCTATSRSKPRRGTRTPWLHGTACLRALLRMASHVRAHDRQFVPVAHAVPQHSSTHAGSHPMESPASAALGWQHPSKLVYRRCSFGWLEAHDDGAASGRPGSYAIVWVNSIEPTLDNAATVRDWVESRSSETCAIQSVLRCSGHVVQEAVCLG